MHLAIMLNVGKRSSIVLSANTLNGIMQSVVMLGVVAPKNFLSKQCKKV
jgi:hypothetical protein